MLKLNERVYPNALTNSNCFIKRGLLQLSNMLLVDPLILSHNRVPGKDHTSIIVNLKHSVKPVIIRTTLRQTPRVNPPLLSGSLCHTLSLVIHTSNVIG